MEETFRIHVLLVVLSHLGFFLKFKMKVPKGNEMKRYMILVCIVLVFIVLSTALAGYVSTNNIPKKVNQNMESLPQWEYLESIQSNLSNMETVLQLGNIF